MSRHPSGRGRRRPPCSSLHPDDGIDPRRLSRDPAPAGPDRATLRLCGQVARLLSLILPDLDPEGALAGAYVVGVEPAPDASRLRVRLALLEPASDPGPLLARLDAASGQLRVEVAAGVHRRRAPDLVFEVDAGGGAR